MSRLVALDGTNLFWRSFHGLKADLTTANGTPTWAVQGTVRATAAILKKLEPSHVLVAFDSGFSAHRRAILPTYKQRDHDDDQERATAFGQMDEARRLLAMFGMAVHFEIGVEADDIIAAAVYRLGDWFDDVVIVSADKDFRQLVGQTVSLLSPALGSRAPEVVWDEAAVRERYGVAPSRLADVFALMGDDGDNVPGIRGVGEKRASALVREFGSAAAAVADPKNAEHAEVVRTAYKLVVLDGSVAAFPFGPDDLAWIPTPPAGAEGDALRTRLRRLEMTQVEEAWDHGTLWRELVKRRRVGDRNGQGRLAV